jgi:hypothetical protein
MNTIIESPFAATTRAQQEAHEAYLREALRDSLNRGEHPYASHAYLPLVLNDGDHAQRRRGLQAGHSLTRALLQSGARWVFCIDHGVSAGMAFAFDELWTACPKSPLLRSVTHGKEIELGDALAKHHGAVKAQIEENPVPSTALRLAAGLVLDGWRP